MSLGKTRIVYVVLKNAPFKIDFGFDGPLPPPLASEAPTVRTQLLYDEVTHAASGTGGGEREVHYISQPPMSFKVVKADDQQEIIRVECRLRVLTSQHEHNYFRVRVTAEGANGESWSAESGPIRVISKPETGTGKKKGVKRERTESSSSADAMATPPAVPSNSSSSSSRRARTTGGDAMMEKLNLILANQAAMMDGAAVASSLASLSSPPHAESLSDHLRAAALALSRLKDEAERVSKVREAADSYHSPTLVAQVQTLAEAIVGALGLPVVEGGGSKVQQQASSSLSSSAGSARVPPEPRLTSSGALSDDMSMYQRPKVCECPSCPAVQRLNDIETLYNTFSM